jgi:hypothetical protein
VRDINFFPNNRHSKFSITISLGIVPDFKFNPATRKFAPPKWYDAAYGCDYISSEWHSALKGSPATTLELSLDQLPPDAGYSLMLGIGIAFGDSLDDGEVKQIKRAGAAKILGIVAGNASAADNDLEGEHDRKSEDNAGDDVHAAVEEEVSETSHDGQRPEQFATGDAPAPLGKQESLKRTRGRKILEPEKAIVYHYTTTSAYSRTPAEEVTYSYTLTMGVDVAWRSQPVSAWGDATNASGV